MLEYAKEALIFITGVASTLTLGWVKFKKIDTDDRAKFTDQLLTRITELEQRIEGQRDHYEAVIDKLSNRIEFLERHRICERCQQRT